MALGLAFPATARAQNILLVNTSSTIGEYTMSGATVSASLFPGLSPPRSMAVSGSNVFVLDSAGVGEYTTSGALVNAALISGLPDVGAIAITQAVPEPGSFTLLGSALLGLGLVYLRKSERGRS